MTPKRLEELKARANVELQNYEAIGGFVCCECDCVIGDGGDLDDDEILLCDECAQAFADDYRADVPELVAEVERLEVVNRIVTEQRDFNVSEVKQLETKEDARVTAFCEEHDRQCKASQEMIEALEAANARLYKVIEDTNNVLFDAQPHDIEHTISCHADTLPEEFRRVATGADRALDILQVVIHEMLERPSQSLHPLDGPEDVCVCGKRRREHPWSKRSFIPEGRSGCGLFKLSPEQSSRPATGEK